MLFDARFHTAHDPQSGTRGTRRRSAEENVKLAIDYDVRAPRTRSVGDVMRQPDTSRVFALTGSCIQGPRKIAGKTRSPASEPLFTPRRSWSMRAGEDDSAFLRAQKVRSICDKKKKKQDATRHLRSANGPYKQADVLKVVQRCLYVSRISY